MRQNALAYNTQLPAYGITINWEDVNILPALGSWITSEYTGELKINNESVSDEDNK
jgi:hypothetical protein